MKRNLKKIFGFGCLILACSTLAYSGQLNKIELTDGSIINGEIISYSDGNYIINTAAFGKITVDGKKVSKVESFNYALTETSVTPIVQTNDLTSSQVSAYGQKLLNDPENAAIFKGLTNNVALQEIVRDAEIQNAAQAGDLQALLSNPKFMNIVNSPEVQEAAKKIKQ